MASERKLPYIAVEQMYAPHQIPWTITGAEELINLLRLYIKSILFLPFEAHWINRNTTQKKMLFFRDYLFSSAMTVVSLSGA